MSSSPLPDSTANQPMSAKTRRSPQRTFAQLAVIAVLSLFVVTIAVPQYLGGWPWATPLKLPAASRTSLQAIPEQGLPVEGWNTTDQSAIELGNATWSIQQLTPATETDVDASVFLLLRPQVYGADQPEVEWLDVKGSQRWETDSYQKLTFSLPAQSANSALASAQSIRVTADLFRAWNQDQTYAVAQWYAWPTGGHPSPSRWFWADQQAQWQRGQRLPWTAISVWIPVPALSDIEPQQALAESVGASVQRSLMKTVFVSGGDSS
ncbi:MAG: cyanoexosortase B system-associated protein [Phormidesmis sp.]